MAGILCLYRDLEVAKKVPEEGQGTGPRHYSDLSSLAGLPSAYCWLH